jgi:hypothetical protein
MKLKKLSKFAILATLVTCSQNVFAWGVPEKPQGTYKKYMGIPMGGKVAYKHAKKKADAHANMSGIYEAASQKAKADGRNQSSQKLEGKITDEVAKKYKWEEKAEAAKTHWNKNAAFKFQHIK